MGRAAESGAMFRKSCGWIRAIFAAAVLFAASSYALSAQSEGQVQSPNSSAFRVIQGRITKLDGDRVTVKTPDGYPGGPGIHAQFVTAGPIFEVDIAHSRILLPDGKQTDERPLAAGDRVIMLLREPEAQSGASAPPPGEKPLYHALIIERTAATDRMVTH
jgi:hypothetical protein